MFLDNMVLNELHNYYYIYKKCTQYPMILVCKNDKLFIVIGLLLNINLNFECFMKIPTLLYLPN